MEATLSPPAAELRRASPPAGGDGELGSLSQSAADLRRILGLHVPVSVVLAEREMTLQAVLELTVGSIIEFNVPFDADLKLHIGNQEVGQGQAVKIGENFGLRITRINDRSNRFNGLKGS
jgi:flagellar motor switch protein FliN/FliY